MTLPTPFFERRLVLRQLLRHGAGLLPLLLSACASAPGSAPSAPPRVDLPTDHPGAPDVAMLALGLVGTPYRFGGNSPEGGFDCSGLIGYVYSQALGLRLPRTVRELQSWGQPVEPQEMRTGDLVFMGRGAVATHAGIVVSQRRFVHAPSTGGTVRMEFIDAPHWARNLRQLRRA